MDIIMSWNLPWDPRRQTILILHEWNKKTTNIQSKRILVPELLMYIHEDRLPNRFIQPSRIHQILPICIQPGCHLANMD